MTEINAPEFVLPGDFLAWRGDWQNAPELTCLVIKIISKTEIFVWETKSNELLKWKFLPHDRRYTILKRL